MHGGEDVSYKIEHLEPPAGDCMIVSRVLESEATLTNQERGKDWEYRVIAGIWRVRVCRAIR